jgi:hypothetical protein
MISKREKDVNSNSEKKFTKRFYKENGLWYIDLPEFIEGGYGSRSNLLMVDGSDRMLDFLSDFSNEVLIEFKNYGEQRDSDALDAVMNLIDFGKNQEILDGVQHAPVDTGAYYLTTFHSKNVEMRTWLCPVASWIFGNYPPQIRVTIVKESQS